MLSFGLVTGAWAGNLGDSLSNAPLPHSDIATTGNGEADHFYQSQPFTYAGKRIEIISPYVDKDNEYQGQLHCHSDESDGADSPADLEEAYMLAGYDFLAITDHNVLTSDPAATNGNDVALFIEGVEETETEFDILNIGATTQHADSDAQDIIDAILADDAIPILAHPGFTKDWTEDEQRAVHGYFAMEVLAFAATNYETEWDLALTNRLKVFGFGSDDCHDIEAANFDANWVQVFADSLTEANIKDALRRGNYYSSNGPDLTVSVSKNIITATTTGESTITWIGNGGATLQENAATTSAAYTIIGDEVYVRIKITTGAAIALSNPIWVYQTPSTDYTKGGKIRGNLNIPSGATIDWNEGQILTFGSVGPTLTDDGDIILTLEADADNTDENHNPRLIFTQDGGNTGGTLGLEGDAGTSLTGSSANSIYLKQAGNKSLHLATNNTVRVTIPSAGGLEIITGDVDFNEGKSVEMCLDNGATLPADPTIGQIFIHTPTGRSIKKVFDGSDWVGETSYGTMVCYADTSTNRHRADYPDEGTSAAKWDDIQDCFDEIPANYNGNITIYVAGGTYVETLTLANKKPTSALTITIQGTLAEQGDGEMTGDADSQHDVDGTQDIVNDENAINNTVSNSFVLLNGQYRVVDSVEANDSITIAGTFDTDPNTETFTTWLPSSQITGTLTIDHQIGVRVYDLTINSSGSLAVSVVNFSEAIFYRCRLDSRIDVNNNSIVSMHQSFVDVGSGVYAILARYNGALYILKQSKFLAAGANDLVITVNASSLSFLQGCVIDGGGQANVVGVDVLSGRVTCSNTTSIGYSVIRNNDKGMRARYNSSITGTGNNIYSNNPTADENAAAGSFGYID